MLPGLAGALHTRRAPHAPPQPRAPLTLSAVCLHGLGLCSVRCLLLFCQVSTLARLTLGPGHSLGRGGQGLSDTASLAPGAGCQQRPCRLAVTARNVSRYCWTSGGGAVTPTQSQHLERTYQVMSSLAAPSGERGRQTLTGRAHLDSRGAHPPPRRGSAVALGKGAPCSFSAGDPGPSPISSPGKWGREVPGPPPQLTQAFPQNNALKPSVPGTGP